MALFTSHSATNKVVTQLPSTETIHTTIFVSGYTTAIQTEVIDTESYRYVGMTKEAAEACMDAMQALYTETIQTPVITGGAIGYVPSVQCVAKIRGYPVAGRMWEVSVDVNRKTVTWGA